MRVVEVSLSSWSKYFVVELPEVGNLTLRDALTEREIADIFNICLRAAERRLNISVIEAALVPEPATYFLEHNSESKEEYISPGLTD